MGVWSPKTATSPTNEQLSRARWSGLMDAAVASTVKWAVHPVDL